jgi:hypothetical protein
MAGDGHGDHKVPTVLAEAGEDDSDVYVLGLRHSAGEPQSWSLMFMECYDADDEQDVALGMDTYCLVVDPGQATAYGGVSQCVVAEGHLRLVLATDTARALGTPTELDFTLAMDDEQIEMVKRGLTRVLTSGRGNAVPSLLTL